MATAEKKRGSTPDDHRMSLVEHLGELRRRVIICMIAVTVGAIVVFILFNWIIGFLAAPYQDLTRSAQFPDGRDLVFTDPLEAFIVRIKVATYGGIVLALPVLLWQVWRFVTPGLYPREKRYAIPFVVSSIVLFVMGGAVAWLTVPKALDFLLNVGGSNLEPLLTANKYLSLVSLMIVAFGAAFEFPLLLVFLLMAGIVTTPTLRRYRRHALVAIAVFAAVITPSQDPYSLFLMIIPMYLFYEGAILAGRLMKR